MSALQGLQRWYHAQCDDDWEHSCGVRIETLDNPGWRVHIDVVGTPLEFKPFDRIEVGEDDSNFDDDGRQIGPWWTCWVEDGAWHAACGPESLESALEAFLRWAEGG
jgi:hypothetical protein